MKRMLQAIRVAYPLRDICVVQAFRVMLEYNQMFAKKNFLFKSWTLELYSKPVPSMLRKHSPLYMAKSSNVFDVLI